MEETSKTPTKLPNQEIDYFKIGKILLSRWYWIVGSVAICMIISNIYLWYTPKIYSTSATMKFEEKKSELPDLAGIIAPSSDRSSSRIQSENIVLQSNALLLSAIKHLDYRFSFYVKGRVVNRTNELYPQKPLNVQLVKFDSTNFFHGLVTFAPVNKTSYSLSFNQNGKDLQKNYTYNVPYYLGPTAISIQYPGEIPKSSVILFKINAPEDFIGRIKGGLYSSETAKNSNIIALKQTDQNPQFAADVLNAIMREYLNHDRTQRRQSSSQMIQFIDSQLNFLSEEVKGSENSIKQYKNEKKIMDVSSASEEALGKAKDIGTQKSTLNIELIAIDQLKGEIMKEKDNLNLNLNLGSLDLQLNSFVTALNTLIEQRNSLLKTTYSANAQTIVDINKRILQIKTDALNSIDISRALVMKKIKYLDDQLAPVNQQISELPAAERDLISLKRDNEIPDKVYSFLSEKKLDAQISSAGILPGATIVDLAQPNYNPVSPIDENIHRTAIIFGLVIGLGLIVLIRVLNPFIYDKETIESLTSIPIIGVIRKFPDDIDEFSSQILAISKPKSLFAESVRSVRTNLSFLASEKTSKIICITSEVAGEGKSFVAVNLASTLSLIDKKVILIAADLRRSKLHKTFRVPNDIGLSSYLANQCDSKDIIMRSSQGTLDFIISGPVPPNPSELLYSPRMTELIEELKLKYDIIMVDTAPIGLVSDAVPLIRVSDINVFVIRSGKSKFYSAIVPQRIAQEYNLDNTVIVLNAYAQDLLHSRYYTTKFTGDSYGTRYYYYSDYTGYESSGYYVEPDEHKWWDLKRWFKKRK